MVVEETVVLNKLPVLHRVADVIEREDDFVVALKGIVVVSRQFA